EQKSMSNSEEKVFDGAHTKRMVETLVTSKCHMAACRSGEGISFPGTCLLGRDSHTLQWEGATPSHDSFPIKCRHGDMLEIKKIQKVASLKNVYLHNL
uniref:Uncharacterized protein n=1 Tax=Catharus ustulatus TaxID=91951 RepID=A0A8C3UQJ8_CATUS